MARRQADAAQLAALQRPLTAGKLAQGSKAVGGLRELSRTHDFYFPLFHS
jgi:hypothetical protein